MSARVELARRMDHGLAADPAGRDGGATGSCHGSGGATLLAMIRVAVLDDHPAVLAGLRRLLEGADGIALVAAAGTAGELLGALDGVRADVAVLDYDLGRSDGLAVRQRLKERELAPGVVVYSVYAGPALVLAARIAGADAVVDKRAAVCDLMDAIRRVAVGEQTFSEVPLHLRYAIVGNLQPDEIPVAAMLLAGTSPNGVAEALSIERREVMSRIRRVVGRLRPRHNVFGAATSADSPTPGAGASTQA